MVCRVYMQCVYISYYIPCAIYHDSYIIYHISHIIYYILNMHQVMCIQTAYIIYHILYNIHYISHVRYCVLYIMYCLLKQILDDRCYIFDVRCQMLQDRCQILDITRAPPQQYLNSSHSQQGFSLLRRAQQGLALLPLSKAFPCYGKLRNHQSTISVVL